MTVKEMIKAVLFDLDGTLVDSSEGILNATKEALSILGVSPPSDEEIKTCIGPPIGETLQSIIGWNESQKKDFYDFFRPIYRDKYIFQCELYPGILQLLEKLKARGILVGIATNKRKDSTESLLQHLGISTFFNIVIAQDQEIIRNKADLIIDALKALHVNGKETIMIGDSIGDLSAAKESGVNFIGVRYGFGFKETVENCFELVNSVDELQILLINKTSR